MRQIVLIFLFCLNFNHLSAQIEKHGDYVWIPIQQYRAIRTQKFLCDTLKSEYDSLVIDMDKSLSIKDSIINNLNFKVQLKDSIIVSKNQTIQALTKIPESNNKFRPTNQLWIGILSGLVAGIFFMK